MGADNALRNYPRFGAKKEQISVRHLLIGYHKPAPNVNGRRASARPRGLGVIPSEHAERFSEGRSWSAEVEWNATSPARRTLNPDAENTVAGTVWLIPLIWSGHFADHGTA
jgi:hypothetical protein